MCVTENMQEIPDDEIYKTAWHLYIFAVHIFAIRMFQRVKQRTKKFLKEMLPQ